MQIMRKLILLSVFPICIIALLTGCNSVKFYSDPALKVKTGLRVYAAKPYLFVERNSADGNIAKATVIYMPDLSNPQYIKCKPGLGIVKVNLKFKDGYLESYGFDSDTQVPETLKAVGSLISDTAGAITDMKSLKDSLTSAVSSYQIELYEIIIGPGGTSLKRVEFP
jgi:hypothetical protein